VSEMRMIPAACETVPAGKKKRRCDLLVCKIFLREIMSILKFDNPAFLAGTAEDFDSCHMSTALSEIGPGLGS